MKYPKNYKQVLTIQATRALQTIDSKSIRPARSITAAQMANTTPNAGDVAKLAELEALAVQWRGVLAELAAGVDPATITLPSEP